MAYEELEAIPKGVETPNIYGPADSAISVDSSVMNGSVRKGDKYIEPLTPWTQQPQIATEIDWSNPLVIEGGIFAVINGATGQLYRRNKTEQLVPVGPASRATTSSGVALYGAGTSDGWVTPSNFDDLNGLAALSGYIKGKSPNAGVLVGRWGTAPNYGGHLVSWDSGEIFALVAESSTTADWVAKRTSGASSGIVRFGFSFSNNAVRPFLSGDPSVGSNFFSGSVGAIQSVGYPLYICRHGDSNSGAGNTYVELVIYGNKPWSDALHKNIDSNPWQIFKPIPRRIFVPETPILPSKVGIPALPIPSKPWTNQPQVTVEIDWRPGLNSVYNAAYGRRILVRGAKLPFPGTLGSSRAVLNAGIGLRFNGVSDFEQLPGDALSQSTHTRIALLNWNGASRSTISTHVGTNGCLLWEIQGDGSVHQVRTNIVGTVSTGPIVQANETCVLAMSWDGSTSKIYKNGGLVASAGYVSGFSTGGTPVFGKHYDNVYYFSGSIFSHLDFNRALSDAEIKSLSDNPWQIFKPLSHKQFVGNNTLPNIQVYRDKVAVRRSSQPQIPVEIDWSNPLSKGLQFAVLPYITKDLVTGNLITHITPIINFDNQIGGNGYTKPWNRTVDTEPLTVFARGILLTSLDYHPKLYNCSSWINSSINAGVELSIEYPTGRAQFYAFNNNNKLLNISYYPTIGKPFSLTGVYTGTEQQIYYNGMFGGSQACSSILSSSVGDESYGTIPSTGSVPTSIALRWNRALSADEIKSISDNPWQIFKPITRRVPNITKKKPQPLLLTSKYFTQIPRYPIRISNNANVIAAVGVSDGIVWNGLTGEKITPNLPGAFWQDQFNTISSGATNAHVWSVPVNFKIHEPFTYVLVWRYNGGASGEFSRQLFRIGGLNAADGFAFSAPDYNDYRRYYLQAQAYYTGFNGQFGDPAHIPYGKDVITVVRSTGLNGMISISDNLGWSNVATGASITSAQYSGHQTRNIDFYTFKDWVATLGMFVMWNRALSDEECIRLTRQPCTVFNSPGYPARLK